MTTFLQILTLVLIGVAGAVSLTESPPSLLSAGACTAMLLVGTAALVSSGLKKTPRPSNLA